MLTEKQLINKWNTIGLLDGLPEHKWGKMSQMYEDTVTILLNNNIVFKNNISNFYETSFFPMIRRWYGRTGRYLDKIRLLIFFKSFDEQHLFLRNQFNEQSINPNIDVDAEIVAFFCDNYEITN